MNKNLCLKYTLTGSTFYSSVKMFVLLMCPRKSHIPVQFGLQDRHTLPLLQVHSHRNSEGWVCVASDKMYTNATPRTRTRSPTPRTPNTTPRTCDVNNRICDLRMMKNDDGAHTGLVDMSSTLEMVCQSVCVIFCTHKLQPHTSKVVVS